jgi:hypothetical protein
MASHPSTNIISGPSSLTVHYNPEDDKIIYIFGEWHSRDSICSARSPTPIYRYLENLFRTTPTPIDLYIESSLEFRLLEDPAVTQQEDIEMIVYLIGEQLNVYNHLPMVRSHYTDPRLGYDNGYTNLSVYGPVNWSLKNEWRKDNERESFIRARDLFFEFIGMRTLKDFISYTIQVIEQNDNLVSKELSRSYKRKEIREFAVMRTRVIYEELYEKAMEILTSSLQVTVEGDLRGSLPLQENIYKSIHPLRRFVMSMEAIFFDVYLLSRMFKRFGTEIREDKSPLFTPEPTNMIIYVGNEHANPVREFLHTQRYIEVEWSIAKGNDNCIDIHKISQPFFSALWEEAEIVEDLIHRSMLVFADDMEGTVYSLMDGRWVVKVKDKYYDETGIVKNVGGEKPPRSPTVTIGEVIRIPTDMLWYERDEEVNDVADMMKMYVK